MIHRKRTRIKYSDDGYWKSYSDMMAALLLMFILVMILALNIATDKENENNALKQKLQDAYGVKTQIAEELIKEFSGEAEVDKQTGDIKFKSDILFDFDKAELKQEGINYLGDFMPRYLNIVLSDKYVNDIAEIIVEGHTDNNGEYMYNLKLSQDRALNVAKFCIENNPKKAKMLKKIITANGRSSSNPVKTLGITDDKKSRRVELKFRIKDEKTMEIVEEILNSY